MKKLKWIGIILLVLIVAIVVFIWTRPDSFSVERTAQISAPPDVVFAKINDFQQWGAWSPWEKIDPTMKKTYEGSASGTGAIYAWKGNDKAGEGRMTILESKPNELVAIKLEFIKPFAATHDTNFKLTPSGDGTKVVWTMEGKNNLLFKAFLAFTSMDAMVGPDFEKGLASLNEVAQAETKKRKDAADDAKGKAPKIDPPSGKVP